MIRTLRKLTVLMVLMVASPAAAQDMNSDPDAARLVTSDIEHFWRAWDAFADCDTRRDSVRALFEHYYYPASEGLERFIRLRVGSTYDLMRVVERRPAYYTGIRANTIKVSEREPEFREAFHRLQALYPDAVFPDVYFLIGRMSSAGTLSDHGLYIGVEMLSRSDDVPTHELNAWAAAVTKPSNGLVCLVVHELIHYQQRHPDNRDLLGQAFREGSADFVAELVTGCHGNGHLHEYGDPRQAQLWDEFAAEMDSKSYSNWMYQGEKSVERPADLGYYIGYKIAEAYYEQADDKAAALKEILVVDDFNALLEESGYDGR